MHVFLEIEWLILRRFTKTDVDYLVDLDSDPEVSRSISYRLRWSNSRPEAGS